MLVVNGVVLYQGIPLKFHGKFLVQDFYGCNAMKAVYKGDQMIVRIYLLLILLKSNFKVYQQTNINSENVNTN
jgi:hypothetical protein